MQLYFPEGHACAGVFKGMAVILEERSLIEEAKLHAECKGFKCMPPAINCCCCRVLYNQPDFVHVTNPSSKPCPHPHPTSSLPPLPPSSPPHPPFRCKQNSSAFEKTCNTHGFHVIYLPNFHCELNFIEQCWGYAKRIYQLNPPLPHEDQLKKNVIAALDCIPLTTMQRCIYLT